jgi:hypothetical protein
MRLTHILLSASLTVAALAPGMAFAAESKNPLYFKVGARILRDGGSADFAGRNGYGLGIGYDLGNLTSPVGYGAFSAEIDWFRNSGNGNRLDSLHAFLNLRIPIKSASGVSTSYYGAGLGLAFLRADVGGTATGTGGGGGNVQNLTLSSRAAGDPGTEGRDFSKTNFAFQIFAGFNFSEKTFAEIGYRFSGKVEGRNVDGLHLTFGFRF